jgi:hypothetical protein
MCWQIISSFNHNKMEECVWSSHVNNCQHYIQDLVSLQYHETCYMNCILNQLLNLLGSNDLLSQKMTNTDHCCYLKLWFVYFHNHLATNQLQSNFHRLARHLHFCCQQCHSFNSYFIFSLHKTWFFIFTSVLKLSFVLNEPFHRCIH